MQPLYEQITWQPTQTYAGALRHLPGFIWLDSARYHPEMGRYSYLAAEPFAEFYAYEETLYWQGRRYKCRDALGFLNQCLQNYSMDPIQGLPPLQSGVMGYFSYQLNQQLEPALLASAHHNEWPLAALGFYDTIVAIDHYKQQAWLLASGFPESSAAMRQKRAEYRLKQFKDQLSHDASIPSIGSTIHPCEIYSNFSAGSYKQAVQHARDYIRQGDIFEVNLSQRFQCSQPSSMNNFGLYCRLRQTNPAPFAAYICLGRETIASASPERFVKVDHGAVQTRPIKGTAPRSADPHEDRVNAQNLQASDKDWAENVMIVDLLRNDLSRVCLPGSIHVPQLCGLESFETVHHLVSVIEGQLTRDHTAVDLLKVSFPGGSITGAPKIRAMEIINELEPTPRGPYCGSIGFIGFDGAMDSSIVIRTMMVQNQTISFQAGGAIVLDSDPVNEYEETLTKAQALIQTLATPEHSAV